MAKNWDYGGAYLRHNMDGIISLPNNSQVKVHDLTTGTPAFMKRADTIFIDTPGGQGPLKSYYKKADLTTDGVTFDAFENALFACFAEIAPKHLFVEVFKINRELTLTRIQRDFRYTRVYESTFYHKPDNRCWIIQASKSPLPPAYPLHGVDEEDAIAWLCRNHPYDVIGDPCMGQGLVGKHAFLAGKPFVGTELNRKRLAVLVDFCRAQTKGTAA